MNHHKLGCDPQAQSLGTSWYPFDVAPETGFVCFIIGDLTAWLGTDSPHPATHTSHKVLLDWGCLHLWAECNSRGSNQGQRQASIFSAEYKDSLQNMVWFWSQPAVLAIAMPFFRETNQLLGILVESSNFIVKMVKPFWKVFSFVNCLYQCWLWKRKGKRSH